MIRAALLALVAGALVGVAPAVALDVAASVNPERGVVGEGMVLNVVVTGSFRNVDEPRLPDLGDVFDVRSAGTSRSYSIVNGKTSASVTFRYRLTPRKEGRFTIGPIAVTHQGTTVQSTPVTVSVGAAPPPPTLDDEAAKSVAQGNEDLFIRATVDTETPFLFEQVTYRVFLYTRVRLAENPRLVQDPETQGFWKESLPDRNSYYATVEGQRYLVFELAFALFPTTPGELTIGETVLDSPVIVRRDRTRNSFLFGGNDVEGRRLRTAPITIRARPLPEGAPAGFTGAVGDYVLEVTTDKTEVGQNEPVVLNIRVSGNGNIKTLGDIAAPSLPDFRSYPQSGNREMTPRGLSLSGSIEQEFVLVPLSAGSKTIPPVELVTFSPRAESYKVLRSRPLPLTVTPGAGGSAVAGNGGRSGIELVGRDIRFIETDLPRFTGPSGAWGRVGTWLILLPLPLVGYAATWVWARRRRSLDGDRAGRRRSRAARAARARLKDAREMQGDARAAAAAAALRGYCADLWNVPAAGLTAEAMGDRLRAMTVDPGPILDTLDRWDAARFAPSAASSGEDPLDAARRWIDTLETER